MMTLKPDDKKWLEEMRYYGSLRGKKTTTKNCILL